MTKALKEQVAAQGAAIVELSQGMATIVALLQGRSPVAGSTEHQSATTQTVSAEQDIAAANKVLDKAETDKGERNGNRTKQSVSAAAMSQSVETSLFDLPLLDVAKTVVQRPVKGKGGQTEDKDLFLRADVREFIERNIGAIKGMESKRIVVPVSFRFVRSDWGTLRLVADKPMVVGISTDGKWSIEAGGNQDFYLPINRFNRHA